MPPKLPTSVGALWMSRAGAELLLGNAVEQINEAARTDTAAADGEKAIYRSGATLVLQVFDQDAGAWRTASLT